MGKQNYRFNAVTGTMEPVQSSVPVTAAPAAKPRKGGITKSGNGGVKLLLGNNKSPENNMIQQPSTNEKVVQFKELSDYTVFQIIDEDTKRHLAYIGGYGLDISFNMHELNSVSKVEQCLEGLKKMFRNIILEQSFGNH